MMITWQPVGTTSPLNLGAARLQLHYAIQFIAATGAALAEPLPDGSHVSLMWNPRLAIFTSSPIRATTPFRVALDPISLTAMLLKADDQAIATLPLHQASLSDGLTWHQDQINNLGAEGYQVGLLTYPSDFPDHDLAHGAAFDANINILERQELTRYYANTHLLLQEIIVQTEDASPEHTWPHHFDMATLVMLSVGNRHEPRTIGIGLSPGDDSYPEPYWYVAPYPDPDSTHLPHLEGKGFWHQQGWVGAVLRASQLTATDAMVQATQVRDFLWSAVKVSQQLLGVS